jgi:hypothetical protein
MKFAIVNLIETNLSIISRGTNQRNLFSMIKEKWDYQEHNILMQFTSVCIFLANLKNL